ncbi:type II toxin-antitoxin system RelE/ParE family toxin [Shinella sp. S4-D37]|uniref:type II toxin-antitoxin system RelE/ParE family toxin n=1 Tax=Shinella sp. S4-D37 TaxID=3161999 RepID=UPI003465CA88
MRVYETRIFSRFARKESIKEKQLLDAVQRASDGLIDADLGGGLIKQRVARPGQGRSGGYRTILVFRMGSLAIFLTGFAKNERENISANDLEDLKIIAQQWLKYPERIGADVTARILSEVSNGKES